MKQAPKKKPSKKKETVVEHHSVELRCSKSNDGKYNASTYVNGKHLKDRNLTLIRSDEFSVVLLYQKLKKQFPKDEVHVKGLDRHGMDQILRATAEQ